MSLLSKSEVLFLQGQKKVSKSYEYKLKSIIKKKVSNHLDKEIPILSSFFPKLNLTESGKNYEDIKSWDTECLTNISKNTNTEKTTGKTSNSISPDMVFEEKMEGKPKFYIKSQINNRKENKSSGGVVRLSISPSQGDDPGFKSRPEHFLVFWYFEPFR